MNWTIRELGGGGRGYSKIGKDGEELLITRTEFSHGLPKKGEPAIIALYRNPGDSEPVRRLRITFVGIRELRKGPLKAHRRFSRT